MLRPGVKAFVAFNNKLLLILRDNNPKIPFPNTWNLPGGTVEENESFEVAIRRELEEEISIVPSNLLYLGDQIYPDTSIVGRYFVTLNQKEYENIKLGEEGQKLDFFKIEDILNLKLAGYLKEYLSIYRKRIQKMLTDQTNFKPEDLGLSKSK